MDLPQSPALPLISKKTVPCLSREILDPSEDSGFSSISHNSDPSVGGESMIGEGIKFVDTKLIEEEHAKQDEQKMIKKRVKSQLTLEKRLAQEAYEKEIQEQQYKRLMHLLTQSKALTSFILKKFDDTSNDKKDDKNLKRKNTSKEDDVATPPAKRGRKPKSKTPNKNENQIEKHPKKIHNGIKKINLSNEAIINELESLSDEENIDETNTKPVSNFITPKYFKGELRDYQKEGVRWMKLLYENGMNGILADEMGLGKTIQVIALFAYLMEKHVQGPYMIMVPLSTLSNWTSEFERFAPQLPVVVYYGNQEERAALKSKLSKKVRVGTFYTSPIVILTYEMVRFETHTLRQLNWRYIVIDEAQRIKNFECQLFQLVKSFKSYNRLLLTGTPLQNNLTELWSLLHFLLPDIFNNLDVFQSWFDAKKVQNEEGKKQFFKQEQEKQVVATLREILHPFMLRRIKEDVCPDIPPMKEVLIYTPLTSIQYDLYSAILKRDLHKLCQTEKESIIVDVDGVRPKRRCTQKVDMDFHYWKKNARNSSNKSKETSTKKVGNSDVDEAELSMWNKFTEVTGENVNYLINVKMSNTAMMYRHVVNHPYLIHFPMDDCGLGLVDENLTKASGKLLVLDAMLKNLKSNGHKVLLFSTMKLVLNMIEDYLSMREYQYVRLDGDINHDERRSKIERFQTDPEVFLFLLTTKAGAVGLNLAAADTVIIYDSDWNPQNDLQAMARCHRIGQIRPVVVYRLCTKGTFDEEIIKRANAKRFLEKAVISKEGALFHSAEGLMKLKKLLEGDSCKVVDSKNQVYTEAELNRLLDRSELVKATEPED